MKLTALVCAVLLPVVCSAASPTIGTISSAGNGESSLANGSVLETSSVDGDVRLESGVAVHLAAHSAGTIFSDHALLNQGAAHVSNFSGYPVQAGQLHIESDALGTEAVIRLQHDTIEIASIGGATRVSDGASMLTRVAAGTRMSFQNSGASAGQTGAAAGKRPRSETKTWMWVVVGISAAALAIGLTAAAQGKSPF